MTKKHFEAAARIVRARKADRGAVPARELAEGFADLFSADNPRFDRARFLAACDLDGETA